MTLRDSPKHTLDITRRHMTRGRLSSLNRAPPLFMVFRFTQLSQQEKTSRQIKLYLGNKVALP